MNNDLVKRFDEFTKEITHEVDRQQTRIDDYNALIYKVETLCIDSNSKLSNEIQDILDEFYQL